MKHLLCLLVILLTLSSCASIEPEDLQPYPTKNKTLLPALETVIDATSFENAYSSRKSSPLVQVNNDFIKQPNVLGARNAKIQDAITIFEREVNQNIINPYGKKKGSILCKIAFHNTEGGGKFFGLVSIFSLGAPFLIGAPLENRETSIDLEVEIYDLDGNLIGRYNSQCQETAWVALYYGYQKSKCARKSNIDAFKCAMYKIKKQIGKDAARLKAQL